MDKRGQLGGFEIDTLEIENGNFEEVGNLFSQPFLELMPNGGDAYSLPPNRVKLNGPKSLLMSWRYSLQKMQVI